MIMCNKELSIVLVLFTLTICQNVVTEADSNIGPEGLKNNSTVPSTTVASSTTAKPENGSCDSYNGHCQECVEHKACYYCQSNEKCNLYVAKEIVPTEECSFGNIRYLTCKVSFEVWVILSGVLAGIVFLVIVCVCCYCCCKKKGSNKLSKDEIKFARQREERKVRAEERKKERASRTDEIRRKYGLVKDDNPYERFDEK